MCLCVETKRDRLVSFISFYFHSRYGEYSVAAEMKAVRPLAVLLGQSQAEQGEEFIHRNMNLRGEVIRKHQRERHEEIVIDDLDKTTTTNG